VEPAPTSPTGRRGHGHRRCDFRRSHNEVARRRPFSRGAEQHAAVCDSQGRSSVRVCAGHLSRRQVLGLAAFPTISGDKVAEGQSLFRGRSHLPQRLCAARSQLIHAELPKSQQSTDRNLGIGRYTGCRPSAPAQRSMLQRGCGRSTGGCRRHENNADNPFPWLIGAHDKWCERIPIESKWISIVSKLRPTGVSEPVVLFVEIEPQDGHKPIKH
jgi:hypothetical protein